MKVEETAVSLLRKNHLTLSLAESCTGGAVSARIVDVPGASEVFMGGFVTYSNEAKRKFLGVSSEILDNQGAVSYECAKAMALGGAEAMGTDLCVSVTGIAGPGGGTPEKPVGTVFIGCAFRGSTTIEEHHFSGDRSGIRMQSAAAALELLCTCIRNA